MPTVWIEFPIILSTLNALVFLPGALLTLWIFPGKRLDWFERIAIGCVLMSGALAGLFFSARVLAFDWRQFLGAWSVLVLLFIAITVRARRGNLLPARLAQILERELPRVIGTDATHARPASRLFVFIFILVLLAGAYLTHLGPIDEDDWSYFWDVRGLADAPQFAPVSLSDRNVIHPWWLIHATLTHLFDFDIVRLGQDWMPAIFVPISLLAFYALARALFQNRDQAIAATVLQFVFFLTDLFNPLQYVPMPGQWFLTRIDQDHTIALFLFLPVFAALLIWYLREGGWALLGATLLAQIAFIATHAMLGIILSALTLVLVLAIELVFTRRAANRQRIVWLAICALVIFGAVAPAIPTIFKPRDTFLAASRIAETLTGNFPISHFRYTFFSPTLFTLRVDFLGQAPALAAIVLTLGLIPFLKKDLAARFLFITSIGILGVLYLPPLVQALEARMGETVLRLWIWNPKALIVAYFLPAGYVILRDGWISARQREWNRAVARGAGLCIFLIGLIAIAPLSLRRDFPREWGAGHALPNGAAEILQALRRHTAPGERARVWAWHDISSAIPGYRATLLPNLFREDIRSERGQAMFRFYEPILFSKTQLEILTHDQVNYLIVSADREIISQCDMLPGYFELLARNSYGALYRVARPLEANDLVEANTIMLAGEWDGAIRAYNEILAADPDNALARTGLGIVLQLLGKPQAAIRELERAAQIAPHNAQAHAHLVQLYRQLGLHDQAAAHIPAAGRLIEHAPK